MAPHRDPIPDERGFPGAEVIACIFGRFRAQRRTGNGYSERSRSRQQIARPYANVEVALQLRAGSLPSITSLARPRRGAARLHEAFRFADRSRITGKELHQKLLPLLAFTPPFGSRRR